MNSATRHAPNSNVTHRCALRPLRPGCPNWTGIRVASLGLSQVHFAGVSIRITTSHLSFGRQKRAQLISLMT